VVGLGWGISVDHMVNGPEIGRASGPIRIQLIVFGDEEEDTISYLVNHFTIGFCFLLEKAEIPTPKPSYVPQSVPLLQPASAGHLHLIHTDPRHCDFSKEMR
jgi:hypothetical protein